MIKKETNRNFGVGKYKNKFLKKSPEKFNSRCDLAEQRINKHEDRSIDITNMKTGQLTLPS